MNALPDSVAAEIRFFHELALDTGEYYHLHRVLDELDSRLKAQVEGELGPRAQIGLYRFRKMQSC